MKGAALGPLIAVVFAMLLLTAYGEQNNHQDKENLPIVGVDPEVAIGKMMIASKLSAKERIAVKEQMIRAIKRDYAVTCKQEELNRLYNQKKRKIHYKDIFVVKGILSFDYRKVKKELSIEMPVLWAAHEKYGNIVIITGDGETFVFTPKEVNRAKTNGERFFFALTADKQKMPISIDVATELVRKINVIKIRGCEGIEAGIVIVFDPSVIFEFLEQNGGYRSVFGIMFQKMVEDEGYDGASAYFLFLSPSDKPFTKGFINGLISMQETKNNTENNKLYISVRCIEDGKVVGVVETDHGFEVKIKNNSGIKTVKDLNAVIVAEGDTIKKGQLIGVSRVPTPELNRRFHSSINRLL
jgi:hypothetical protein